MQETLHLLDTWQSSARFKSKRHVPFLQCRKKKTKEEEWVFINQVATTSHLVKVQIYLYITQVGA
jgi:hypothetical protein